MEENLAMNFQALHTYLTNDFSCLAPKNNAALLTCTTPASLAYVLSRYWLFTAEIVQMLSLVRDTAKAQKNIFCWQTIATELERNIDQEYGSETHGIAHCDLLAQALASEVSVSVSKEAVSPGTQEFFRRMYQALRSDNPLGALGAAYALESSAVPELRIVLKLLTRLKRAQRQSPGIGPTAKEFFDLHLNVWEPSHECGLRETASPLLTGTDEVEVFSLGYIRVLSAMESWWTALTEEAVTSI